MQKYNLIFSLEETSSNIIKKILNLREQMPEILNENIEKIGFVGNFPYCIWAKHNQTVEIYSYEKIENELKFIADNNLMLFFEFDNTRLEEKHFNDTYMNMILKMAQDVDIYALVYNEKLSEFIKNKYEYIKTVNIRDLAQNSIYTTDIEKDIETLNKMSEDVLNFEFPVNKQETYTSLSLEDIEKYAQEGIKNFIIKINDTDKYDMINKYINYLIKPDYRDEVRLKLLKMLAFPGKNELQKKE